MVLVCANSVLPVFSPVQFLGGYLDVQVCQLTMSDSYIPASNRQQSEVLAEDNERWVVKLKELHKATQF